MISSLFISVPLEFGYEAIMLDTTRLPSWAVTVDSAKTSLPAPPRQGNGACENRPLLIPRLKSFREASATSRTRSQYITIAKASCQAFRGSTSGFFSRRRETHRRQRSADADEDAGTLEKLQAATIAARFAPRCTTLVSDHRGGSLVVGGRWNRRHVRRWLARFRLALECELEHLVYPLDRKNFQSILDVVRDFCQILHVLVRDEDGLHAAPVSREELLLQSADHQDFAAQGDLAGHRHIRPDRNSRQHRHHRGADADSGARAVLGRRAFGEVNVDVVLLVEVLGDAEPR